jgi:hypothetical protein
LTLSTSINADELRDLYGRLEGAPAGSAAEEMRQTVDAAFKGVTDAFAAQDYHWDRCDAAEELVGLLLRYFLQSNPSFRGAIPTERPDRDSMGRRV